MTDMPIQMFPMPDDSGFATIYKSKPSKATLMRDSLLELLKLGWTTPIDALQGAGCFSLSQRCGEFRRDGLTVLDKWVSLPSGKKVKAYMVLDSDEKTV